MTDHACSSPLRRALLALVAAASSGCVVGSLRHVQAGGAVGTSGALGGALEGSLGGGVEPVGLEVTARAKFTDRVLSGALGAGGYLATATDSGTPFGFAHLGLHALQVDVIDATPYVSAFSPYLSLGLGLCVLDCQTTQGPSVVPGIPVRSSDLGVLTFGLSAEYDVRFARDGEGFFGLSIGYARYSRREPRRPF